MRWTVHGERTLYDSEWVRLTLVDVEIPDGARFEHHVLRAPSGAAGTIVHDADHRILMLWRHRFITDTWGWEIPAGRLEPGEEPEAGAVRETVEETGWRPEGLRHLVSYRPSIGLSDQRFDLFVAGAATRVGEPTDPGEAERVEWVPIERVRGLVAAGQITDGLSLTALLYAMAFGPLGPPVR
jgi:8-oxo-dGTP pyrophosphatase MutT (NUDIX family)